MCIRILLGIQNDQYMHKNMYLKLVKHASYNTQIKKIKNKL